MRNLLEYPVTRAEKIAALLAATEAWQVVTFSRELHNATHGDEEPVGDITAAALAAIMDDYAKPA
jgi:hypothetical protein